MNTQEKRLEIVVNGRSEVLVSRPDETLAEVLRERLHLTGTKVACQEGECGSCTVLVNGRAIDACIFAAQAAHGLSVETVEGINDNALGATIQKAIVAGGGVQCGFCTPGFVMMVTALLREYPNPNRVTVREALAGNICRCTGYVQIEDAIMSIIEKPTA